MTSTPITLYTLAELRDIYGWSKDTLYDLVRSGELGAFKVGKTWHVTAHDLDAFIAARPRPHITPDDVTP